MNSKKHEPLFACRSCSEHKAFPPAELRMDDAGALWCKTCWDDGAYFEDEYISPCRGEWHDLPPFIPEHVAELAALRKRAEKAKARVAELEVAVCDVREAYNDEYDYGDCMEAARNALFSFVNHLAPRNPSAVAGTAEEGGSDGIQ